MANLSYLFAVLSASSGLLAGCVVAEPVPYEPPPQSPPVLDLWQALPWVGAVIPVDRVSDLNKEEPDSISFQIPVRSEDRDEWLQYCLHIDYQLPDAPSPPIAVRFPPSTFDDDSRVIKFTWNVMGVSDGCHQLTLVVAHERFWDDLNDRWRTVEGLGDFSMASWWINVNPAPGERYTLRNCPTVGEDVTVDQ